MSSSRLAPETFDCGIKQPGFACCGLTTQARRFSGVLSSTPEPISRRLIRCVRSGPIFPLKCVPFDGVASPAACHLKTFLTRADLSGYRLGLLLFGHPFVEIGWFLRDNLQQHVGVLYAAELGTASPEDARYGRINPSVIDAIGNQIGLAAQFGYPEAVNHVL